MLLLLNVMKAVVCVCQLGNLGGGISAQHFPHAGCMVGRGSTTTTTTWDLMDVTLTKRI